MLHETLSGDGVMLHLVLDGWGGNWIWVKFGPENTANIEFFFSDMGQIRVGK